jgi:hypothetical protein
MFQCRFYFEAKSLNTDYEYNSFPICDLFTNKFPISIGQCFHKGQSKNTRCRTHGGVLFANHQTGLGNS